MFQGVVHACSSSSSNLTCVCVYTLLPSFQVLAKQKAQQAEDKRMGRVEDPTQLARRRRAEKKQADLEKDVKSEVRKTLCIPDILSSPLSSPLASPSPPPHTPPHTPPLLVFPHFSPPHTAPLLLLTSLPALVLSPPL